MAISSPLLEASIDGARGVLLSISGGSDLGLFEINEAAQLVSEAAHPEANIIFGAVIDDALGDEVRVTVIAAGFDGGQPPAKRRDNVARLDASQPGRDEPPLPSARRRRPSFGVARQRHARRRTPAARPDAGRRPLRRCPRRCRRSAALPGQPGRGAGRAGLPEVIRTARRAPRAARTSPSPTGGAG